MVVLVCDFGVWIYVVYCWFLKRKKSKICVDLLSKLNPMAKTSIWLFILFLMCENVFGIMLYDTISPPPYPSFIIGVDTSCVNDTCYFSADFPLNCNAQWYVDGVLQNSIVAEIEIIWESAGVYELKLVSDCNGVFNTLDSLDILVNALPEIPESISGETETCVFTSNMYSTAISEGEYCEWTIDGEIQSTTNNSIEIFWDLPGNHFMEVKAINQCGISEEQTLEVFAQTAPFVDLGNDTTIIQGEDLLLDAGNMGCNYLWSTGEITQTIVVSETGNYWVDVTNVCGTENDSIYVDVFTVTTESGFFSKPKIIRQDDFIVIEIENELIKGISIFNVEGKFVEEVENKNIIRLNRRGFFILQIQTDKRLIGLKLVN